MLVINAGNNIEFIYDKNYDNNKYEIKGLRFYKVSKEDGTYIAEIDDLDALISAAQRARKDISEFNNEKVKVDNL